MRAITVAAMLVAALPLERLAAWQCPDGTPPPCARPGRPAAVAGTAPSANSVAVLYFENGSRDTADAYLADGITEELIVRLGQVDSIQVKPRGTVKRFRGSLADPATLGRQLNVAYVVTGTVRKSGTRVSVVAELARTSGGVRVWGDVFDRTASDLLAIESDIARAVATAIAGRLRPNQQAVLTRRPTTNPAAYDAYLRGNAHLVRRGEDVARAIHRYEDAVARDPSFAAAWGRLAVAYTLTTSWGYDSAEVTVDSLRARAVRGAARALALDSSNSDAWLASGAVAEGRNRGDGRLDLMRSLAIDSTNAEAEHQLGLSYYDDAALVPAEQHLRRSVALEPDRGVTWYWIGNVLYEQRRFRAAAAVADTMRMYALFGATDAVSAVRARLRARVGDRAALDSLAVLRAGSRYLSAIFLQALTAQCEALLGDTAAARARLSSAIPADWDPQRDDRDASEVILAYASSGQMDRAIALLEQRAPQNRRSVFRTLRDPVFDPVRADPRLQRLMELVWPR